MNQSDVFVFVTIIENEVGDGFEIYRGFLGECTLVCLNINEPSYVARLIINEDGDEEIDTSDLMFTNVNWDQKYAK